VDKFGTRRKRDKQKATWQNEENISFGKPSS
jgi:hypothetical protein